MTWAPYFWPIEEFKEWEFRSTVAPINDYVYTRITTSDILTSGEFIVTIEKTSPYTYWGPETRWEDCVIHCKMDEHGIYMTSLKTLDANMDYNTTKVFSHFTTSISATSPWLHNPGWPVYPFIPENGLLWDQLGKWNQFMQLLVKPIDMVYHNLWNIRCSIERLFVPYLATEIDTLRVDYLETNTPCVRNKYFSPIDFTLGWDLTPQPDGPLIIDGTTNIRTRPI